MIDKRCEVMGCAKEAMAKTRRCEGHTPAVSDEWRAEMKEMVRARKAGETAPAFVMVDRTGGYWDRDEEGGE